MEIRRAFITGGAGFIGSHVVDALLARGVDVVVYDNFSTGRRSFLPTEGAPRLRLAHGDVLDLNTLEVEMAGSDFVFHFQANADVRGGRDNTRVDLEQNTIATWNVLDTMRKLQIKGIAFASSATVYGDPEIHPTPENFAPLQTSLYGASKYACEAMIQAYGEYFGIRSFIFRFVSWIGERYTHGVIFDILKKLAVNPKVLPLLGDGTQRKSYLYVKDGVGGILAGIGRATGTKNVFNLGHDEFLTVKDLAYIVLDELKLNDVRIEFAGGRRGWVGDSPLVHLDTTRLKELGWKPQTNIEEGVRRTVRYLNQHRELITARK